jgi:hypothetical protein
MFGLKQKRDENIKNIDFKIDDTKKIDMPMNLEQKWDEPLPFDVLDIDAKPKERDVPETKPREVELPVFKLEETRELEPVINEPVQAGTEREDLEMLSKRIEDENRNINRRFKIITKNVNQLTLESQELIDLIKLYANTNGKFNEFIEEMHRLEERGWNFDQNIAAFYKFRVGKALADMKKQSMEVEKICRKVGFTPSNIKSILKSPIEDLISSLTGKTVEIRKSVEKRKSR